LKLRNKPSKQKKYKLCVGIDEGLVISQPNSNVSGSSCSFRSGNFPVILETITRSGLDIKFIEARGGGHDGLHSKKSINNIRRMILGGLGLDYSLETNISHVGKKSYLYHAQLKVEKNVSRLKKVYHMTP
jgi:hypothetical protein